MAETRVFIVKSCMKKSSQKAPRRNPTWTFQPDDDVRKLVERMFGKKLSRGQKTALINQAIRLKHGDAAVSLAEEAVLAAKAKLDALKDRAEGKRLQSE